MYTKVAAAIAAEKMITSGVNECLSGDCGLASAAWDALGLGRAIIFVSWLASTGL